MSLSAADIPDVIVKPGRMVGGGGRLRSAAILGGVYVLVCLLVLVRVLYHKEMQLERLALIADDTQLMVGRLQQQDQQLEDDLELLDEAIPHFDY